MGLAGRGVTIRIRVLMAVFAGVLALGPHGAAQESEWEHPAADLARHIAEVLGPATAHLTWANLSAIPADALPAIRRAVEHDLAADGVNPKAQESSNQVRITLSQDARGGLWVAEIQQGDETRVVMVRADVKSAPQSAQQQTITLQRRVIARSSELLWNEDARDRISAQNSIPQILAASERNQQLIVLTTSRVAVFEGSPAGWSQGESAELGNATNASRDPRGLVMASGEGFSAMAPGIACSGLPQPAAGQAGGWTLHCQPSDDPWPIAQTAPDAWLRAFYNAGRNYFTGVVTPALGTDLPPFYTAALLSGSGAPASLLMEQIDGTVMLLDGNELKAIAGTHDWGSDFAPIAPGCGAAAQVLVSSSGEGTSDSLRVYEIRGQGAQPVSEPLALGGAVMSVTAGAGGKSAIAIVRIPLADGQRFDYEVDRVTASCN